MAIFIIYWHPYIELSRTGFCCDLCFHNVKVYKIIFRRPNLAHFELLCDTKQVQEHLYNTLYGISLPHQVIKMSN